jgi:hypothetical protein
LRRYRFHVPTTTDELRERLEDIGEALADLAMDALRSALEDGDDAAEAKAQERRLTRARRSVEKAAALLADREPDLEA